VVEGGEEVKSKKFSNEIFKMATVPQAIERYKISRKTLMKYAEQYGALVRFGRSVCIDVDNNAKLPTGLIQEEWGD